VKLEKLLTERIPDVVVKINPEKVSIFFGFVSDCDDISLLPIPAVQPAVCCVETSKRRSVFSLLVLYFRYYEASEGLL